MALKHLPKSSYVVIGTATQGGMQSVIRSYESIGFYRGVNYLFICSHVDGPVSTRAILAAKALLVLLYHVIINKALIVHAHTSMNGSFWRKSLFAAITLAFRRRFILHLHGSRFREFYERLPVVGKGIVRLTLRKCSRVVVLSPYWQRFVETLGCRNVVLIPNWVIDRFGKLPIRAERQGVLFLGEIGARKGTFDLIHAYGALVERLGRAAVPMLYLAGNGMINKAKALIERLGIQDKVLVVGWVTASDLEQLFAKCGIFVLPSYNEGLPMAILEAMNAGTAIISTPSGGIPDVLNSSNGMMISPGDIGQLTDALARLVEDAELRTSLAEKARADYHALYSPDNAVPLMRQVYSNLLQPTGSQLPPNDASEAAKARENTIDS